MLCASRSVMSTLCLTGAVAGSEWRVGCSGSSVSPLSRQHLLLVCFLPFVHIWASFSPRLGERGRICVLWVVRGRSVSGEHPERAGRTLGCLARRRGCHWMCGGSSVHAKPPDTRRNMVLREFRYRQELMSVPDMLAISGGI